MNRVHLIDRSTMVTGCGYKCWPSGIRDTVFNGPSTKRVLTVSTTRDEVTCMKCLK